MPAVNLILLRQRNFGLLWSASLISITGDWALRIALPVYVLRLTGSAAAVSGVVLAGIVLRVLASRGPDSLAGPAVPPCYGQPGLRRS